jgi:hypothetical protein
MTGNGHRMTKNTQLAKEYLGIYIGMGKKTQMNE